MFRPMAHNRSPGKIRSDVLMSPLGSFNAWFLEVDCAGGCPRGRVYRVSALARAHGDRTVHDVVRLLLSDRDVDPALAGALREPARWH
jgi:hypothetical protein